jgi:DNA repair protein RadC
MPPTARMPLKDLPAEQRPREKLLARGARRLERRRAAGAAAAHRAARPGVLALATQVLERASAASPAAARHAPTCARIKGLGPAKRAEMLAVMEMARRALAQPLREAPVFDAPQQVKDYVRCTSGGRTHEVFAVLFLDASTGC